MKQRQLDMFPAGEDLPLFTGTPVKIVIRNPIPHCPHCADTGLLGEYAFCSCEAGQAAEAHRVANGPKPVRYFDEEGNEL